MMPRLSQNPETSPDHNSREAFLSMLRLHEGIIRKVVRSYCWNETGQADLAQEIVLQLWRSWPGFQADRRASVWVYRIALNVAIDAVRSMYRPTGEGIGLDDLPEADLPQAPSPEQEVGNALVLEQILASVAPLDRALLILFLEGHDHTEIAAIFGLSVSNISTRLHRLKLRLGKQFGQEI